MFLLFFTAVVLYLVYGWIKARPPNFPPGPAHVPIIGSVPFLPKKNGHFVMEKWREQYGPVVGFLLGNRPTIAVCSSKMVREVLKRDEFQGRPIFKRIKDRTFGKRIGIMFSDGPIWQEQRRFTMKHLKDFGFGKTSMENLMLEEVQELIEEFRDKRMQVSGLFNVSSVNVLWAVMAGTRYKRTDPKFQNLMENLTRLFRSGSTTGGSFLQIIYELFPKLMLPKDEQAITSQLLNSFFAEVIQEHEKTLNKNDPRDFIDVYIMEMQEQEKQTSTSYNVEGLIAVCTDLFSAGSESVGNTLGFALLYMILYPEIQQKVHDAIDNSLGRNRMPSLQDRSSLQYVEAVLLEIMRCNTIAPVTVPHRAMQDTTLNGYFIPKNTMVLVSLWSIFQDPDKWGDPENFRPSRFLDGDGQLKKDESFIPFGVGKRLCPGEALARNVLFLFFSALMQEFTVSLAPGSPKPSTECLSGFTTAPQPFEVIFNTR